jgi:predicted MFS family arabinose efflux permease
VTATDRWHSTVGVGFVLAFHTAIVAAAQAAPTLAPIAALDIGVEPERIGYFTAVVFAAALLSANGIAGLMARIGSFMGAALTLVFIVLGLACLAVARSASLVLVGALFIGIAYGPVNPLGSRILIRVTSPRRKNFIFSLKQSSVSIGGVLAGIILPVMAASLGWRTAIAFTAILPAAVAAAAFPVRKVSGDDANPLASARFIGPVRIGAAMLADPNLRGISLAVFSFAMTQFGFMSVYVTLLWQWANLSPQTAAAMLSMALGASIAGRLFWGWRADAGHAGTVLMVLAFSGAVVLCAMLLMKPDWPLVLIALLSLALGLGPMSWSGVLLSEVAQIGAARSGSEGTLRVTAGSMVFGYLGGLLGPASLSLSAALTDSYAGGVAVMAVALALTGIAFSRAAKGEGDIA